MLGKPKFKYCDKVRFKVTDEVEKVGKIEIIDKWGTFFDKSDVCYDIRVEEENCLYKHYPESCIVEKAKTAFGLY